KKQTGTTLRFWPDPGYFDSPKISLPKLRHLLRAKAVLCAGLTVRLTDEASGETNEWHYEKGLRDYLRGILGDVDYLPPDLFLAETERNDAAIECVVAWVPDGELTQESYVNL